MEGRRSSSSSYSETSRRCWRGDSGCGVAQGSHGCKNCGCGDATLAVQRLKLTCAVLRLCFCWLLKHHIMSKLGRRQYRHRSVQGVQRVSSICTGCSWWRRDLFSCGKGIQKKGIQEVVVVVVCLLLPWCSVHLEGWHGHACGRTALGLCFSVTLLSSSCACPPSCGEARPQRQCPASWASHPASPGPATHPGPVEGRGWVEGRRSLVSVGGWRCPLSLCQACSCGRPLLFPRCLALATAISCPPGQ